MILQATGENVARKLACLPGVPDALCEWLAFSFDKAQPSGAFGFHLFDIINAILLFYTIILIKRSMRQTNEQHASNSEDFVRSLVDTRYDALDRLYFDLLKERRERAYSPGVDAASDPYPQMVWNFIETIIDKCREDISGSLARTWSPVMASEAREHSGWLTQIVDGRAVNARHFKREFFELASGALIAATEADAQSGAEFDGLAFMRLAAALELLVERKQIGREALAETLRSTYLDPGLRTRAGWNVSSAIGSDADPDNRRQRRVLHERRIAELADAVRTTLAATPATA